MADKSKSDKAEAGNKGPGPEDLFSQFDPANMARQFQEMLANSPFSQFDTQAIVDAQSRNLEAMKKANETAVSGARTMMQRQAEMVQQAMVEAGEAAKKLSDTQPEDLAKENIRLVEEAMQKSMKNFSEINQMAQGVYADLSKQMEARIEESMQELKDAIAKVSGDKE